MKKRGQRIDMFRDFSSFGCSSQMLVNGDEHWRALAFFKFYVPVWNHSFRSGEVRRKLRSSQKRTLGSPLKHDQSGRFWIDWPVLSPPLSKRRSLSNVSKAFRMDELACIKSGGRVEVNFWQIYTLYRYTYSIIKYHPIRCLKDFIQESHISCGKVAFNFAWIFLAEKITSPTDCFEDFLEVPEKNGHVYPKFSVAMFLFVSSRHHMFGWIRCQVTAQLIIFQGAQRQGPKDLRGDHFGAAPRPPLVHLNEQSSQPQTSKQIY